MAVMDDFEFGPEVEKQTEFSITCYKRLFDDNIEDNVCASPLSISLMLAMVAAGARGPTRDQFCKSLLLPPGEDMHEFAEEMMATVFVEHWHSHHHGLFHGHQQKDSQHAHHHHHNHHRGEHHGHNQRHHGHHDNRHHGSNHASHQSSPGSSGHLPGLKHHSSHTSPGSSGHLGFDHSSHGSGEGQQGHHPRHHHVAMRHNNHPHGPLQAFSNGLWLDKDVPVKESFAELLKEKYMTEVHAMDFRDKGGDTSWHPGHRLSSIGSPTSKIQGLILTNALYFRGRWKEPFHEWHTKPEVFHLLNGHSVKVPMMTSKKKRLIGTFDHCKVLKLPYHDDADDRHLAMYIILPDARYGLLKLESKLNPVLLHQLLKSVTITDVGQFKLPRFKISAPALDVREVLQGMGLHLPFVPGAADFSDVVASPDLKLHISTVLHQAFIEVNEGETRTSAAAHTLLGIMHIHHHHAHHQNEVDFVADHPFLFLIKDDSTDAIVFMGRVTDPSNDHHQHSAPHSNGSLSPSHGHVYEHADYHDHAHGRHRGLHHHGQHHRDGHHHNIHHGHHHPKEKHHWYSSLWEHIHF